MPRTQLPKRLSYEDAAFVNFERDTMPLNVGSVGIYEGIVAFEPFRTHVDRRIDLIPRYRQRLVPAPFNVAHAAWIDDPHFDIGQHVRPVTLAPPGGHEQLSTLASDFFAKPLSRDKPLWEILLVHGVEGHRTAHIAKVHHCLVDGVSGVDLLAALLDLQPRAPAQRRRGASARPPAMPQSEALLIDALADALLDGLQTASRMASLLLQPQVALQTLSGITEAFGAAGQYLATLPPEMPWNRRLSGPRRLAWTSLPFERVHAVASSLEGTINDVVLTVLAGALGRYARELGVPTAGVTLRVACPVNVRDESQAGSLGNRVSFMLVGLPLDVADPIERYRAIHTEVAAIKKVKQPAGVDAVMKLLGALPAPYHALMGQYLSMPNTLSNLICTNIPGPLAPLYLMGHRMEEHYPWVPLGWRMGLSVAVMSYNDTLGFGIVGDGGAPGDLGSLAAHLGACFEELAGRTEGTAPVGDDAGAPSRGRARVPAHLAAASAQRQA